MNYSFNAFWILSSALLHKQNMSSPSNIISPLFCVIFARITHVKVCSVKYSCSLVFFLKKMRKERRGGRNPVKFGCVVGGGRLRRRSRSGEEEDFDKVEMEQEDPKKKILGGGG